MLRVWVGLVLAFWIGYMWANVDDDAIRALLPAFVTLLTLLYLVIRGLQIV